jgi:RND family efflux transporter MFP subunit
MRSRIVVAVVLAMLCQRALAEDTFVVAPQPVADEKAVFATVESAKIVPARARIGGTVVQLAVRQGDRVEQDQAVATVADKKLTLQIDALDAQIAGLKAELTKAKTDLARTQELYSHGTASKVALDSAQTAFDVATESLKARTAERSVIEQQITEGTVLAPAAGRVLTVPVTMGTVVLAGEPVATVAGSRAIESASMAKISAPAAQNLAPSGWFILKSKMATLWPTLRLPVSAIILSANASACGFPPARHVSIRAPAFERTRA